MKVFARIDTLMKHLSDNTCKVKHIMDLHKNIVNYEKENNLCIELFKEQHLMNNKIKNIQY